MLNIPEDFKYTKSQIALLNSACELFYKYGIRKVSIEDICTNADLSKMTFYRAFKDKKDIVSNLFRVISEDAYQKYLLLSNEGLDFKTYLYRTIQLKKEFIEDISSEFMSELLAMGNDEITELSAGYSEKTMALFMSDLERAKRNGEVKTDLKPEFVLYMIQDINNKAHEPYLLSLFKSPQDLTYALLEQFFYGIIVNE